MSEWSDFFNEHMQFPEVIKDNALFWEESILAANTEEEILDQSAVRSAWKKTLPRDAIIVKDRKFLFMKDIVNDQEGFSLSIYQRIKAETDKEGDSNIMFVSRMDNLMWAGVFSSQNTGKAVPHIESMSSYIFTHLLQGEDE